MAGFYGTTYTEKNGGVLCSLGGETCAYMGNEWYDAAQKYMTD